MAKEITLGNCDSKEPSNNEALIFNMVFSHYPKGYTNKKGQSVLSVHPINPDWTVYDAYKYIVGENAKEATMGLRDLVVRRADIMKPTKAENDAEQEYKKLNFEIATFGGEFSYRKTTDLTKLSGLVTIDIDHLGCRAEVERIKSLLIQDKWLVSALCFTSPRADGLKDVAIVPEAWRKLSQRDMYLEVRKYILFTYGIEVDDSGSDISRACYLPHDPECYINPKFIINTKDYV